MADHGITADLPTIALVANGQAGALLARGEDSPAPETLLRQAGLAVEVIPPEAGTLPERIALARDSGAGRVVVAGGDGSVACAAQALAGTGQVLGIIPGGTMNLLAKDLHIDPADQAGALRTLYAGGIRAIDVAEVSGGSAGDSPDAAFVFLCASMLGTPARLSRHREAGRQRGNGLLSWAGFGWAALRALIRNRSMRLVLRLNGETMEIRSPSVTITVNPLDDASGRLFGRSVLDGGTLAVYIVKRSSLLTQIRLLVRTALSGNLTDPEITILHTTALEVDSPRAAIHLLVDGEARLLKPPLRYTVKRQALRVAVPE